MNNSHFAVPLFFAFACLLSCAGKKADVNTETPNGEKSPTKENVDRKDTLQTTGMQATKPGEKPKGPLPVITFKEMHHDFGTIEEGKKVTHRYLLTNTGAAPLVIQSARPSCGCTVSAWSKDPIPVGGSGFIEAKFDSKGRLNVHNKTVTVTANTWPRTFLLHFRVMVVPKKSS